MAAALAPMIVLTNQTPDEIPADVIAKEQDKAMEGKEGILPDSALVIRPEMRQVGQV